MPSAQAQAPRSVPQAPVSAPLSAKAISDFMQLKSSLAGITSWELATGGPDEILPMIFTEGANPQQAQAFAGILK